MDDFIKSMRSNAVDEATRSSIVAKCQENEFTMRGGLDWQEDPWLEEYPYDVIRAATLEELSRFFNHTSWATRQCVLYADLAFVQQVDGGDEWWTLKRVDSNGDAGDWLAFESTSCSLLASIDPERFKRTIACMAEATPRQCSKLDYMTEETRGGDGAGRGLAAYAKATCDAARFLEAATAPTREDAGNRCR